MAISFPPVTAQKRLMFLKSQRQQYFKIEKRSRLFKTHLNTKQPAFMVFVWGGGWAFRFHLERVPVPISERQRRFCGLVPVPGKKAIGAGARENRKSGPVEGAEGQNENSNWSVSQHWSGLLLKTL